MAHDDEKRRDPRVPLVLRVDYPGTPDAVRDATENLSAGGLFIRTDRELSQGERLPLQISFPGLLDGIEVEVEVVRRRPATSEAPAGVAVKIPLERIDERHKLARLAETARAGGGARPGGAKRAYRVLVVEDNPHVVEMYEYALRKLGGGEGVTVSVEYALNGHAALKRLAEPPRLDLVMSDLYMPVLDGFSLIERIRSEPSLPPDQIVALTNERARRRVAGGLVSARCAGSATPSCPSC